ncbi:MAG: 4-diphosphocytidyl-2C-methyl-D-erythritol kinase, partial [Proteobacteria bacterium]|nr:4-diphosphocytidyl-2C-methyl-D-erythritol kinase [Pseudomonadota bacterium]
MIFATLSLDDAEGAILAHGVRLKDRKFAKGRRLDGGDIATLRAAGFTEVMAARLERDDVGENDAAARTAQAIAGPNINAAAPFTGRCNLYATVSGLLQVDRARIDQLNAIDEAVTVATVNPGDAVATGQLVATVKVIPFAISTETIEKWASAMADAPSPVSIAPFEEHAVGLLLTHLPCPRA